MRLFLFFIFAVFVYGDKLSIGFSSINPPREVKSTLREVNDGIVKERHLNIRVKYLKFKKMDNDKKEEVSESLDDFAESLYDAFKDAGPSLATKEQKDARFNDLSYKGISLTPKNIKKLWVFHEDRKKYGVKFLAKLAKNQKLDILIYQKVAKVKWRKFGENIENKGTIKPTIAVFNNFSQAQTYSYPKILAEYIQNEEYEKMNEIIETKVIDALKKAFSVGVINSSIDTSKKTIKKKITKINDESNKKNNEKKLAVSDIADMGGTGGF